MNRIAAATALAAVALVSVTACDPGSEPSGTVVSRQGGAPMSAKGATLTLTTDKGEAATVVIPAGVYESCHVGSQYPKCK